MLAEVLGLLTKSLSCTLVFPRVAPNRDTAEMKWSTVFDEIEEVNEIKLGKERKMLDIVQRLKSSYVG